MENNDIITLIGKSSSGKDTLARILEKDHGYNFIVSTTTRPMRPGESEKNPYYFVSNEKFEELINDEQLIEYRTYNTLVDNVPALWYYGVEKKEVSDDKKYVVVLDIIGLKEFQQTFGSRVKSFYIYVDDEERKQRCVKRGDFNEPEWNRRCEDDNKVFSPEIINEYVDYTISSPNNDELINLILDIKQTP